MKRFFSNGIFTFDSSTIILMHIIMSFISLFFTISSPQNWLTYVFEGLYTILDILILFAIVKRNKTILNIGFWITMIFFIYYSIECVIFIPLSYITMDDLNWALKEYGPKGRQVYSLYLEAMENYFIVQLLWWFHGFIYLCAINEARRECTELKQMSADNEMEKKPII